MTNKKPIDPETIQDDLAYLIEKESQAYFAKPEIYESIISDEEQFDLYMGALLTLFATHLSAASSEDPSFNFSEYLQKSFDAVAMIYHKQAQSRPDDSTTESLKETAAAAKNQKDRKLH